MKIGKIARVSVSVVHEVLKSKAEIAENSECDTGLYYADEAFPRNADIGVNPVIIASKREVYRCPEV
jgi:hypothetical protein